MAGGGDGRTARTAGGLNRGRRSWRGRLGIALEVMIANQTVHEEDRQPKSYRFESEGRLTEQGEQRFVLELSPEACGKLEYRIRLYPQHELLTHPFELGMMRWL